MSVTAKQKEEAAEATRQPKVLRLHEALEGLDILDELIEEHADAIEKANGDIEAIPEIAELLAFAEGEFEKAVERMGLKIRTLDVESIAASIERDRLQHIVNIKGNARDRLKSYLKRNMEGRNIAKVETPKVRVRIQTNGGKAAVKCESEGRIEELFAQGSPYVKQLTTYALDTDAILAAVEEGKEMPAGITVLRGTHLRLS